MMRRTQLFLFAAPLLLAACGGGSGPTAGSGLLPSSSVTVSASKSVIKLTPSGMSTDTPDSTTFTFINKAGGAALNISSAVLKFGTSQTLAVTFGGLIVPSGFSCSDGSISGCSTANLQFTEKTLQQALKDADLFGKIPALNGGLTSIPVELDFDGVANPLNLVVSVGSTSTQPVVTPLTSPAPVITINSSASAPYSGNLNVTVSGNFDAASTVDRLVLQTVDATGNVDNTTYVSNQQSATFSIDTTKFPDGTVTLKAIAITKIDTVNTVALRGESVAKTISVLNITAPVIALASPNDGSIVTSPTLPVQITVTRKNSAFTIPDGKMLVDLLDYRGQPVATQTITGVKDNVSSEYTTSFDVGGLPVDTYTLRVRTLVSVAGSPASIVTTVGKVTTKSVSLNPPASVIRFPVAITKPNGSRSPAMVDSGSGFFATVSDDVAIGNVEARIVGPYPVGNIETDGTKQCQSSGLPLGTPIDVLLLNVPGAILLPYQSQDVFITNLDIDGSTYVPDSVVGQRYDLRVTVSDKEGNRNTQCVPIVIQRNLPRPVYATSISAVPDPTPKAPKFSSATWTLSNVSNNSRVAAIVYAQGIQVGSSFYASVSGGSVSVSQNFSSSGTYEVKWVVEDMITGGVTTVNGGSFNVGTNP